MSGDAESRGWGPGWPHCNASGVVTVICGGDGLRLPVRAEIARLIPLLVADLEQARGSAFRPDQSWGYSCRSIAGTATASNHSWGLAIDLDSESNPQLTRADHAKDHPLRKTFPGGQVLRSTMPDEADEIAQRYGFRWGGMYRTKPDPMHFEFMETPEDANRRCLGDELVGSAPSEPVPPTRTYVVRSGDGLIKIGRRLGIDWRKLAADNNVQGPKFVIFPGQVLFF